jgi:hypothetical protein
MALDMKSLILISLLFLFGLFCNGQSSDIKIDYDYFLLGSLNDYMGREKYKEIVNRVDEYAQNNKSLVFFLDSIFQDKHQDLKLITNEKTGRFELESKELAQKMNDYYFFKPSGRGAYCGEVDLGTLNLDSITNTPDFYTTYFDTIYTGRIKGDIFKNDTERLSFIAGAYIRFGGKNDSIYFISVDNSISKVKEVTEQLKEMKCTNVEYSMKKGYIPVGHTVYFTPTDKLKKYFNAISQKLAVTSEQRKE